MTYIQIVNILRNTAIAVNPTGTFMNARRSDGGIDSIDMPNPLIHLYFMKTRTDRANDNQRTNLIIAFWEQDTPETSNLEREAIIGRMDILRESFMSNLYTQLTQIENEDHSPEYRQLSGTMSGVGLSFDLIHKIGC